MELVENAKKVYKDSQIRTIISYSGTFDSKILTVIAQNIDYSLSNNPIVSRKVFKIFIELAQNVSLYSIERGETELGGELFGVGVLILKEYKDYYSFATGNLVDNESVLPLLQKCDTINSLDREQLREYKRKLRKMPSRIAGGGNIGLVQSALTADYPMEYKIIHIDDEKSFYVINVKVNKS